METPAGGCLGPLYGEPSCKLVDASVPLQGDCQLCRSQPCQCFDIHMKVANHFCESGPSTLDLIPAIFVLQLESPKWLHGNLKTTNYNVSKLYFGNHIKCCLHTTIIHASAHTMLLTMPTATTQTTAIYIVTIQL